MARFVSGVLGAAYVTSQAFDSERSFADAGPGTPVLVFLSPGVDVAAWWRRWAAARLSPEAGNYVSVSLGQGQAPIAMAALPGARGGGMGAAPEHPPHHRLDGGPLDRRVDKLGGGAPRVQVLQGIQRVLDACISIGILL